MYLKKLRSRKEKKRDKNGKMIYDFKLGSHKLPYDLPFFRYLFNIYSYLLIFKKIHINGCLAIFNSSTFILLMIWCLPGLTHSSQSKFCFCLTKTRLTCVYCYNGKCGQFYFILLKN